MPMLPIEKGVPPPSSPLPGEKHVGTMYPFRLLEVGDSFVVPKSKRASVSAIAYKLQFDANFPGLRFTLRTEGDKVRVWRIA